MGNCITVILCLVFFKGVMGLNFEEQLKQYEYQNTEGGKRSQRYLDDMCSKLQDLKINVKSGRLEPLRCIDDSNIKKFIER